MDRYVEINNRKIGSNYPPYIVAELSANHNGDIKRAFKIMEECKNAGADAVKIQTYKPDTITINCDNDDFKIKSGLCFHITYISHVLYPFIQLVYMKSAT